MSRYTIYYNKRQCMYRDLATRWSRWSKSYSNLTEEDFKGISMFFKMVAKRFGLIREFRELGVINDA
jgi:hypothetical protein